MSTERFKGRPPIMTQEQLDLLKTSSQFLTAAEWADKFGVHVSIIFSCCRHYGLPLMGTKEANERRKQRERPNPEISKKIKRVYEPAEKKTKMVRPPARYDNRSQEDVINHYLKLEI